jgi:hypothetical protein
MLGRIVERKLDINMKSLSNTAIMHTFIINLCKESNPDRGLCLSKEYIQLMKEIKDFNYNQIYFHPRIRHYKRYATLIILTLYKVLCDYGSSNATIERILTMQSQYPQLGRYFLEWMIKYSDVGREAISSRSVAKLLPDGMAAMGRRCNNKIIYNVSANDNDYRLACLEFIAGMTDIFAEKMYKEIIAF